MSLSMEMPSSWRLPKIGARARRSFQRKHREVLAEDLFLKILCWERKRAERSRKLFLLMLVDSESAIRMRQGEKLFPGILSALSSSTRETDIVGWYEEKENGVLGVILTEIGQANGSALQSLMHARLSAALHATLEGEQVDQIRISFHFFPEDWKKPNRGRMADEKLYPDLSELQDARKVLRFAKRAMDIVGSIVALFLFSPLFLAIAFAIKLTSKGPILFKQKRVGQYGTLFTFLKFRSMQSENDTGIHREYVQRFITGRVDSAHRGQGRNNVYKIQDDPRITRVGKFLRKTSLDELPQFINVLKGEMSLVGPRPPIPYELEAYQVWHLSRLREAKPGITGLWQVNGRSRTKFDDMVRLDLRYARTWSLWLDLQILLQTPRAIFSSEGAY